MATRFPTRVRGQHALHLFCGKCGQPWRVHTWNQRGSRGSKWGPNGHPRTTWAAQFMTRAFKCAFKFTFQLHTTSAPNTKSSNYQNVSTPRQPPRSTSRFPGHQIEEEDHNRRDVGVRSTCDHTRQEQRNNSPMNWRARRALWPTGLSFFNVQIDRMTTIPGPAVRPASAPFWFAWLSPVLKEPPPPADITLEMSPGEPPE